MKNVTVSLPEEVAKWARIWAAEHDTSVSKMLGQFLKEKMEAESLYNQSMHLFLLMESKPLKKAEDEYPSRDKVHER